MAHQFNIFLLLAGALQGAFISFFLLRKQTKHPSHIFFILFLIVVGLQLTFKAVAKGWLWNHVQPIYLLSYSMPFLIGPLLYFFVRTRVNSASFQVKDSIHFIPFVLHFTQTLITILFEYSFLPSFLWMFFPWPSLDLLSLFGYGWACWRLLHTSEKESFRRELKQFVVWVLSAETIIIIAIAFLVYNIDTFPDIRLLFVVLTLLIYWISYKLMTGPEMFLVTTPAATISFKVENTLKYAHSGLKKDEADRIEKLLKNAIYQQKIFLEADISMEDVAVKLSVSKHHLSRVINERFGKTYMDLANEWRLEEARSRLANPKYKRYTIAAIAMDSGFNSVSSFNTIFKRQFNITPSSFRNQYKRGMSA
jgi:AraC-like DNA-binding protein